MAFLEPFSDRIREIVRFSYLKNFPIFFQIPLFELTTVFLICNKVQISEKKEGLKLACWYFLSIDKNYY